MAWGGAACVAYGSLVERRWYRLRREALSGALRTGSPGHLRALHVSDLHLASSDRSLAGFIRSLAEETVDLVVATGDLVGAVGCEDATVELLAALTASGTPGVAVLGSNDFYGPAPKSPHHYFTDRDRRVLGPKLDTGRLRRGLEDTGWRVLENQHATFELGHAVVEVAGLVDPHLDPMRLPSSATIAAREPNATLRLGLVHAPYVHALDLLAAAGYGVILAGHTHGGQVRLPPFGALVTNCDLPPRLARGSSRWPLPKEAGSVWLHVSAGLGQSRYAPIRFACRPEASLLEFFP
ncbi:MAG: metallophosphoesterase [Actinomycetota bacterium]|nr:metallophosphoesterase [Actinomycetota bacterium]